MERLDPHVTHGRWRVDHLARYRWAAQYTQGFRVLDAATGCGYGAALLRESGAREVIGIDRAVEAITWANERYVSPGVAFHQLELSCLTVERLGQFDVIVSFETLEHLLDPHAVVAVFRSLLAPGGQLLCSVPSEYYRDNANPYHLSQFELSSFREMLAGHFPVVALWEQRFLLGSDIAPADQSGITPPSLLEHLKPEPQKGVPDCYLARCLLEKTNDVDDVSTIGVVSASDWRADQDELHAINEAIRTDAAKVLEEARRALELAQADARQWQQECTRITAEWEAVKGRNDELMRELDRVRRHGEQGWREAERLSAAWAEQQAIVQDAQSALRRAEEDGARWREEAQRLAAVWQEQNRLLEEQARLLEKGSPQFRRRTDPS